MKLLFQLLFLLTMAKSNSARTVARHIAAAKRKEMCRAVSHSNIIASQKKRRFQHKVVTELNGPQLDPIKEMERLDKQRERKAKSRAKRNAMKGMNYAQGCNDDPVQVEQ